MESTQATAANGVVPVKQEKITIDVSNLPTMAELERQYLNLVLAREGGSKQKAAKVLGFSVKTIYNKLDSYRADETDQTLRPST